MSAEFKSPRVNANGSLAPILLVGAVAEGKERKLISILSSDDESKIPFVVKHDFFEIEEDAENKSQSNWPVTTKILSEIDALATANKSMFAVFNYVDECSAATIIDLINKITANKNCKIPFILSCSKLPEFIERSSSLKDQLQIVQFELPPKPPVLQVNELEESPFHYYAYQANFLAKYPQQINDPEDAKMLTSLAELMKAVEGIEGGILGQEAHERGMDGSVIESLAAFSRAHKGSENELADGIARAVIKELLACPVVPKFIEVNPPQKQPTLDWFRSPGNS
jgi:hypothetical protein